MTTLSTLALEKLDALDTFQDEPCTLQTEHDAMTLRCHLQSSDRLSCSLLQLHLQPTADRCLNPDRLQQCADRLCRRVTYLLEPLSVIEADPLSRRVLMRSSKPLREADARTYYELLLDTTGAMNLRRNRCERAHKEHRSVPYQLTKEALAKLINDLAEVLS